MAEYIEKLTLLDNIRSNYTSLEALLASLSPEQMTSAGVNDHWSVKDNLAHISEWQRRLPTRLQTMREGKEPPASPYQGLSDDEANALIYQNNKDRTLDDVLADFHSTSLQAIEAIENTSEEDLNRPLSWLSGSPLWLAIRGNTYEHYQEHTQIIKDWLANSHVE